MTMKVVETQSVNRIWWIVVLVALLSSIGSGLRELSRLESEYLVRVIQPIENLTNSSVEAATMAVALLDRQIAERIATGLMATGFFHKVHILDDLGGTLTLKERRYTPRSSPGSWLFKSPVTSEIMKPLLIPKNRSGQLILVSDVSHIKNEIVSNVLIRTVTVTLLPAMTMVIFYFLGWRPLRQDVLKLLDAIKRSGKDMIKPAPVSPTQSTYSFREFQRFHKEFADSILLLHGQITLNQRQRKDNEAISISYSKLEKLLKQRESQLLLTQKMEAMGQLTAGVAHDFNNLLAIISTNTELLKFQVQVPEHRVMLENMYQATQRGGSLTRKLLSFAGRVNPESGIINLNTVVTDLESLFQRTLPANIHLAVCLDTDLRDTQLDPALLETALLNLLINAREQLSEGGKIIVRTANVTVEEPGVAQQIADIPAGHYVTVAVEDNGTGIPDEIRESIFEPFFTTKQTGSGLGLSMVYGFVHQSGGKIAVEQAPDQGTVIRMYFQPPPTGAATAAVPEIPADLLNRHRGDTILVVEDNDEVRQVLVSQLIILGFHPLSAANGAEAIDIITANNRIDTILSDLVMPGPVQGDDLYLWVRENRPDIHVILITGYPENRQTAPGAIAPEHILILVKPVSLAQLAKVLGADVPSLLPEKV